MNYFVGIDVGAETCVAAMCSSATEQNLPLLTFANTPSGIRTFEDWLLQKGVKRELATICMESCGVYAEVLCYAFHENGWRVHVEPPHKVRRAMPVNGPKSDELDAQNIARYAVRFFDELHQWQPRSNALELVSVLLTLREGFTEQSARLQNQLQSFKRKKVRSKFAESMLTKDIQRVTTELKKIDAEIKKLIDSDSSMQDMHGKIDSVPGVGSTLAAFLMVQTNCFTTGHNAKELSSFLGIAPLLHQSGTSVNRVPRSRGFGHDAIRRLLYLAAMSACTHNDHFKEYFSRMVGMGKKKRLVINNVENKIIAVICAIAKSNRPYDKEYVVAS